MEQSTNPAPQQNVPKDTSSYLGKLEEFFLKLPPLPQNMREVLVKMTPWFSLIVGIFAIFGLFGGGLMILLSPLALLGGALGGVRGITGTIWFYINMIVNILGMVLELLAVKPLFDRSMKGWRLLLYATLISGLSTVFHLPFGIYSLVWTALELYLLYQIKSYYK